MWRNILCHAFMQIIMLLILIFVLPGWLVKDYLVLQQPFALTPTVDAIGTKTDICEGFWQPKFKTCTKLNAWYAAEVYQDSITIADWKKLAATKDSDYDEKTLEALRCWLWQEEGHSAEIKAMGGLANCTTAKLDEVVAKDKKGILMTEWYPQDFTFGVPTQKCIHYTLIF